MSSDIEHWHINATVFKDRVEETHYISDPARNVRRRPHKIIWQVERLLGRGGFGEVRLERNKEDGKARAVKRIATTSATLSKSECEKELKALLEFSKPKSKEAAVFVEFFGWFKDGPEIFLAMEYVQLGDLERNVAAHSGKIPEIEARDIAEQILSGLEIMHAESFAHRDLKPQNILVVNGPPQWWVKLADFGLSKRLTDTTAFYTRGGTQAYMAPEVLDYLGDEYTSSKYTNAVDIWAVGCIIYRLMTGRVPFPPGTSLIKYCENKSVFPYDALLDSGTKRGGSEFIRQLLLPNPKDRPPASQALKHEWILSDIARTASDVSYPAQTESFGISELTLPGAGYNTVSHVGLKSYNSSSPASSSRRQSSDSSSNASRLSVSSEETDTLRPMPPGLSETTMDSISIDRNELVSTTIVPSKGVKPIGSGRTMQAPHTTAPPAAKRPGPKGLFFSDHAVPKSCRALYDYTGVDPGDLSFREDDTVQIIEKMNHGWWKGSLKGKQGIFPSNYVVAITEFCRAMYKYTGVDKGDLSFRRGDTIQITERVNRDWLKGTLEGKEGIFPSNHVVAISKFCRALYDFIGERQDELSFRENDTIQIIETINRDWWKGSLKGQEGLIPSNYVDCEILSPTSLPAEA